MLDLKRPIREADIAAGIIEVGYLPKRKQALHDHLVSTGEKRGRPSRSITTETLARTVDQLDQHYKCSGCNLGKRPDTRRMVFVSWTGSRDTAHDRCLRIAAWRIEPLRR